MKTTSNKGINLIKEFEGCVLEAYLCRGRVPTIGWGTTIYSNGIPVKIGDIVSQERADKEFLFSLKEFEAVVNNAVKVPINQNQFDALVSFTYNLGPNNLRRSTLLKKLNQKDYKAAALEFRRWNKVGRDVVAGLTRRRKAEEKLFSSPDLNDNNNISATWLKLNPIPNSSNFLISAYNGGELVKEVTTLTRNKQDLIEILNSFPNAKTVLH